MQIMYGIAGERRLEEYELPWLAGYEGSRPVRVGNAAAGQLQLDVYGEVLDAMYQARRLGLAPDENGWKLERALVQHLETIWQQPDEGIWEVRGGRRQFTASKVMVWVAFDRAIRSVEEFELEGPVSTVGGPSAKRFMPRSARRASILSSAISPNITGRRGSTRACC